MGKRVEGNWIFTLYFIISPILHLSHKLLQLGMRCINIIHEKLEAHPH